MFIVYGVIFQYSYTRYNYQMKEMGTSITLDIYHFFLFGTYHWFQYEVINMNIHVKNSAKNVMRPLVQHTFGKPLNVDLAFLSN